MAELRCEGLAKSYGSREVLADVDLTVPEGTLTAILGASGSGKTTLLRIVVGFVQPDRGQVAIGGTVVADGHRGSLVPEKRGVGYVAQEGALYPHLNVGDNVGFGLRRAERKGSRVGEVLELVGLGRDDAARRPHELSGGEQRRVALARALAPRPSLVLLDEPFSGLDAALRLETRAAVLHALSEARTTALLVTHDQAEALSMGREVAVLRNGRLVQTATPQVLYEQPADLGVARFVGAAVVVPGSVRSGVVRCPLGTLPVAGPTRDGPGLVVIRPEQIQLQPRRPDQASADGLVLASVISLTYYGPDTAVGLAIVGAEESVLTARIFSHLAPGVGDQVQVAVLGSAVVYQGATDPDREWASPGDGPRPEA